MGKNFSIVVCCLCLIISVVYATDFDRNYEPVIINSESITLFDGQPVFGTALVPIDELFLFAYRENSQLWEQIPFQIDERKDNGEYVFPGESDGSTGNLDTNDELVFMAKDAGDRKQTSWIDDVNSQNYNRLEIKVIDPITQKSAWVYLYRSTTLVPSNQLIDYLQHFPSTTANMGEDRVESLFYKMAHGVNGLPNSLIIPQSAGGNGQDLIDRMKFRSQISLFTDISLDENDLTFESGEGDKVLIKDGLIRVIRKLDTTLKISLGFLGTLNVNFITPPGFFYPYSSNIKIEIPAIESATVNSGRMSMDFSANASSMKFKSHKNQTAVNVDGVADAGIDKTLDDQVLPDRNWMYYGPGDQSQGTVVTLFPVGLDVGNSRELYYKDNSATDNGDTGDKQSYADAGIALSGGIATPFTLNYEGYYLASQESGNVGSQIADFVENPFQVEFTPQNLSSVPVELVAFSAEVEENKVYLTWQTASESNNFGFDIEVKSTNDWQKIGFVEGKGTTSEPQSYQFTDANVKPGDYSYRLKQIDTNGAFEYTASVSAAVGIPSTFALGQNYPNPFNPTTTIEYKVSGNSTSDINKTVLKIYNLIGQEIKTLVNSEQAPGYYTVTWEGRDNNNNFVPTGIYIYRLQSGLFVDTKKMLLVK